jgi:hypothetical protein
MAASFTDEAAVVTGRKIASGVSKAVYLMAATPKSGVNADIPASVNFTTVPLSCSHGQPLAMAHPMGKPFAIAAIAGPSIYIRNLHKIAC